MAKVGRKCKHQGRRKIGRSKRKARKRCRVFGKKKS